MKRILFFAVFLTVQLGFGQLTGDYQSNGNVTFATVTNWQMYNGTTWVTATTAPKDASYITSNTITVRSSDAATISITATIIAKLNVLGTFTLNNGANLSIGPIVVDNNGTPFIVSSGSALTVNGNFTVTKGDISVAGTIYIDGNFSTNTGNVDVTGSGSMATSGSMTTQGGGGSIFGSTAQCPSGPCTGTSLNCPSTISLASQTICQTSQSAPITTTLPAGATVVKWQSTTDFLNFTDISNTTTVLPAQTVTQTTRFRAVYTGSSGCSGSVNSPYATVIVNPASTVAAAGVDQAKCNTATFTLAGNIPAVGTGVWTLVTGTATITTPTSNTSGVTGVPVGTSATLRWSITNGACASTDDVVLTNNATPTTANAGPNQAGNGTSFTLAANTPTVGTGQWTIVSGPSSSVTPFSSVTAPNALFTPLVAGTYTLAWTITNGSCTSSSQVVLTSSCISNLIINGDFTSSTKGNDKAIGWSKATTMGAYVETHPEDTYFSTGTNGYTAELDKEASLRQTLSVVPGVSYTLSFRYARRNGTQAPNPSGVTIKITGGTMDIVSSGLSTSDATPQLGTYTFTPTASEIGIELYNHLATTQTYGTIIDDIVLVPSSQVIPIATTVPKGVFNTFTTCIGSVVQLDVDNVPNSGVTYSWTGSSGASFSSINIKNPTVSFNGSGTKSVTVTVTSANGCTSSSTTNFNVKSNLPASVSIAITTGTQVSCSGTSVTFTATLTNGGTTPTYQWTRNDTNIGGATSVTYTGVSGTDFVSTDIIRCVMTSNATPCLTGSPAKSSGLTMTVNPNLPASVSIAITTGTQVSCSGTSVTFTATPTNGGTTPTYQWTRNGTNIGGATSVTYTGVSGTDFVNTDIIGCVMTSNATPCLTGSPSTSSGLTMTVIPTPATPVLSNITLNCNQTTASQTWNASSNTSNYRVDVFSDVALTTYLSGFQNRSVTPSATATESLSITGLLAGQTYYMRVKAVNSCGVESAYSNIATISLVISQSSDGVTWDNGGLTVNKIAKFTGIGTINVTSVVAACSCIVDPNVNVVIKSLGELILENGLDVKGTLVFENNTSLKQTNPAALNTGSIEYQRKSSPMKNFDFTYWSSPVANQNIVALSPNTLSDKYFRFDPLNGWIIYNKPVTDALPSTMIPGAGYIIRVPKPGSPAPDNWSGSTYEQTVTFKGIPNNGTIPFVAGADQFNLIGNPYPSAIDADLFITGNSNIIYGALYFWTHKTAILNNTYTANDYATYTLTGGVGTGIGTAPSGITVPSRYIGAGQSFFVGSQKTPTATKFEFTNAMRVSSNNTQFFKQTSAKKTTSDEKNRVWLNLTNSQGAFKQLLVGYLEGATNDWDNLYDGPTFDGQPFVDFYSLNQGKKLTIQGRALPFEATDEVPLGYRSTIAGPFEISIDSRDGNLTQQEIWLEDKKTATVHDLTKGSYTFTTINGVENDRFVLKYTNKTLGTDENTSADKSLVISIKNKRITVTSSEETITQIQIFDLLGRKIYDKSKINAQEYMIDALPSTEQALIVKTTLANGAINSQKVIF